MPRPAGPKTNRAHQNQEVESQRFLKLSKDN